MSLIVTKLDATTDVTFDLVSEQNGKKTFLNKATGLTESETIEIEHNLRPAGAKGSDRHTIRILKQDVDDVTGNFSVASFVLTISIPRASAFTNTVIGDMSKYLQCLLKATFIQDIKVGITTEGDYHVDSYVPA